MSQLDKIIKDWAPLVGRIFITVIFILAGIGKIKDPTGTQQYMAAYGMPMTGLFLVLAIIVELGGSLSLLCGFKARWAAGALFAFLVPTTLIFHTKFDDMLQVMMFQKNLAIMGGLLAYAVLGAGPISVDGWIRKRP